LITEFKNIHKYNNESIPFGIAQVGRVYRKEISPRPFVRLREFEQAEIEVFHDPQNPLNVSDKVLDTIVNAFSVVDQDSGNGYSISTSQISIRDLVKNGLNTTIAHFMCKIKEFMTKLNVNTKRIRFRQRLKNELAHYSSDCWDMEYLVRDKSTTKDDDDPSETNWIEVIGITDRGCFDLTQHHKFAMVNASMMVKGVYDPPVQKRIIDIKIDQKTFCKNSKSHQRCYVTLSNQKKVRTDEEFRKTFIHNDNTGSLTMIEIDDTPYQLDPGMVTITDEITLISQEEFIPHIIEPSFGVDRMIYTVLNSNFWVRSDDEDRTVISLPASIAPINVSILPLFTKDIMMKYVKPIEEILAARNITYRVDCTGASIGKRYSRLDEIGVPFAITIDHQTDQDQTVTVRRRDDMSQIGVKISSIGDHLSYVLALN
jgi:glycyl-tRNA synthetase